MYVETVASISVKRTVRPPTAYYLLARSVVDKAARDVVRSDIFDTVPSWRDASAGSPLLSAL